MTQPDPLRPGPIPAPESIPFWQGLTEGVVRFQRCVSCGCAQNYARVRCSRCWADQLAWEDARGTGTIWTWTVVHRPAHPAWQTAAPYAVVITELDDGPRLTTRWRGGLHDLAVDLPVRVSPLEQDGYHVVAAEPAGEAGR